MPDAAPWEDRLRTLRDNRTLGATNLALEAIDLAAEWIAAGRDGADLAVRLQAMHPAIATVGNVGRIVAEESGDLPVRLCELRRSIVEGNRLLTEKLRPLIAAGSTVITLSNSSTVRDALTGLRVGGVYVLQSLPGGEGAQMAEALRKGLGASAEIDVAPDAAMGNLVPTVDCALVGIDTYDHMGAILHKVGTLPLALCCSHFGKPFYAAGHSLKRTERTLDGAPERHEPAQTSGLSHRKLSGKRRAGRAQGPAPAKLKGSPRHSTRLFDCTPAGLITELLTV